MSDIRDQWTQALQAQADTIRREHDQEREEREAAAAKRAANITAFTDYISTKLEGENE